MSPQILAATAVTARSAQRPRWRRVETTGALSPLAPAGSLRCFAPTAPTPTTMCAGLSLRALTAPDGCSLLSRWTAITQSLTRRWTIRGARAASYGLSKTRPHITCAAMRGLCPAYAEPMSLRRRDARLRAAHPRVRGAGAASVPWVRHHHGSSPRPRSETLWACSPMGVLACYGCVRRAYRGGSACLGLRRCAVSWRCGVVPSRRAAPRRRGLT